MRKILTVDVGGTFIKYAVVTGIRSFKIAAKNKIPTPKINHAEFMNCLADIFNEHNDAEGIAVAMPGIIDSQRGICLASAALSFNNGQPIAEELQKMCGVPVVIENDANCAALAEIRAGSLVNVKDSIILVFGTMVGGTLIRNREIQRGAHNCAGEISFTLKNIDAFSSEENFYSHDISARAFQRSCAKVLNLPPEDVTAEIIFDLINDNDDDMLDALYKYAHGVAVKILNLQMIFDPERFALGGAISAQQSFIDAVHDKIDELYQDMPAYLPRPDVVACRYRNDANLLGALYRYLKKV